MKLRSAVIASLAVAGLISSPAMATAKHLQNHKHNGKASRPLHGKFDAQAALATYNNAKSPVSTANWTDRIHMSGMVNVDARFASRGPIGIAPHFAVSDNSDELNVNNANLFVDIDVNRCVSAHVGLAYVADSVNLVDTGLHTGYGFVPLTESIRSDKGSVFAGGEVSVDEAYISIGNFAHSPIYFRAGKMYVPFGTYSNPYPISYGLTQLLSQTRATTFEFGVSTACGWYGSLYVLDGAISSRSHAKQKFQYYPVIEGQGESAQVHYHGGEFTDCIPYTNINNYGVKVGYQGNLCNIGFHANAGYLKDIRDVSYLADLQDLYAQSFVARTCGSDDDACRSDNPKGLGMKDTGALAAHVDATYCNFNLSVDYVAAVRNVVRQGDYIKMYSHHDSEDRSYATRLWATDITGTYCFGLAGYHNVLALSYQFSRQAGGILPKNRYQGDWTVQMYRNTYLTFEYRYDQDYDAYTTDNFSYFLNYVGSNGRNLDHGISGGTDHSSNQVTLRLGVVF